MRGSLYGLSAGECLGLNFYTLPEICFHSALGKTGAAVGTQAFTPIQNNLGKRYVSTHILSHSLYLNAFRWTFIIAAICGVTGILITYFFIPDMTDIDLADEDAEFLQYLAENGWDGHVGEDDEGALVKPSVESGAVNSKEGLDEKA